MKYGTIVENKLRIIEEKLNEIRSWKIDSFDQLKKSSLLQNAVERALQVAVEAMIDTSERILSFHHHPPVNSAIQNMEAIEKLGIINDATAYQELIRFRNFIVHRYERIDLEIVYSLIRSGLGLFERYVDEIRRT
ncbi:MAG: HepT-like ribonuclease domain-containing protein [Bacteroidales bacterium]